MNTKLAERAKAPDRRSKFQRWLDSLSPEHHAVVMAWLADRTFTTHAVANWIREDLPEEGFTGYRAHKETIRAWRVSHGIE